MNIIGQGLAISGGQLEYAWFKIQDGAHVRFRALGLRELAAIPLNARDDPEVLGKQWAAVRGMYNAEVNFLYSAVGIFSPAHVGIVQYYGAAGEGASEELAAREALHKLAAVEATLANYQQSKMMRPTLQYVEWYVRFIADHRNKFLAILGYPDPRIGRHGLGRDGLPTDQSDDDLASEQNEILFRGMAKLREDFVFQVTAEHIDQVRLTQTLMHVAQLAANPASRQHGRTSISLGVGIPLMAALAQSVGGGHSAAASQAHSSADGVSVSEGRGQSTSWSHTDSHAVSQGGSETWGTADSHGTSVSHGSSLGHTDSQGSAHTDSQGTAHTDSQSASHSEGSAVSSSQSWGMSHSDSQGVSQGMSQSESHSTGDSMGSSTGHADNVGSADSHALSNSVSNSQSAGHNDGLSVGNNNSSGIDIGVPGLGAKVGGGNSFGVSAGDSSGQAQSIGSSDSMSHADSAGHSDSVGASVGHSVGDSVGTGSSIGQSTGSSDSYSSGGSVSSSSMSSDTVTQGSADTTSHGTADTVSHGSADSRGTSQGVSVSDVHTDSHSISKSWGEAWGTADSVGGAKSQQQAWGQSHSEGESQGAAIGSGGQTSVAGGLSTGLIPSLSLGQSWDVEDDVAIRLTEILRSLEGLVDQASREGGFMTSAFIIAGSDRGATAAAALVPQAFHGPNVPTPILTLRPDPTDELALRNHAIAFLPMPTIDLDDPFDGRLWTRYSTLLTAGQVAAYTAPGLFEEGTAQVVTEQIPPGLGFYPDLPGLVSLGHQYSPETADLTTVPVRLDQARHFHTLFAADTGYGKTVAAIRMVYETVLHWHLPTVVLDWGAGWRQLLNAPGLDQRVNILQLWPHAARPLRWNPLQIGRNIPPETQWRSFADIFGAIARLGVKRQKQELLEALREVYLRAGILIDDPRVRTDAAWGRVRADEQDLIGASRGTPLGALTPDQRQALAVYRSRLTGLTELYTEIKNKLLAVPARDTMLTGVLEGILFRMNGLVQGAAAVQYAAGTDTIEIEDLIRDWGVTIIEGGSFLDEFGKAFLLGWLGWRLYTDAVARRVHSGAIGDGYAQIVFEEANKIFGGIADSGGEDEGGGRPYTSQQFGNMFRDSRKYGIWLWAIAQSPHQIPEDIISSCNNLIIGFLKNPKDKDLILSALAKSEKGFTDEPWRRFLSDLATGQFIGRLGMASDRYKLRPMLFRPWMIDAPEPADREIADRLGAIAL